MTTGGGSTYWRRNVRIMAALLVVWAAVGLGGGVLFADRLAGIRIGGFPLGFWIAQQGSIMVFVLLILVYAVTMNRLDAEYVRKKHAGAARRDEARRGSAPAGRESVGSRDAGQTGEAGESDGSAEAGNDASERAGHS